MGSGVGICVNLRYDSTKEIRLFPVVLITSNPLRISSSAFWCNVHLSIRVSEMTLQDKHVRILAINDINSELDDKEIDSWIRLTRVLTHEIMNSVTPITSLSDTLLSLHQNTDRQVNVATFIGKRYLMFVARLDVLYDGFQVLVYTSKLAYIRKDG